MATQTQIREDITNQIVAAIEAGTPPWRQPWSSHENAGAPTNAVTKRRYSGVNPMILQLSAARNGFRSKYWATFRQWQQLGGCVKRRPSNVPSGRWGTNVVFYKPIKTTKVNRHGIEEETTFPILRSFTLFNADQCDGVDQFQCRGEVPTSNFVDYAPADEVIDATPADIRFGGDRAFYNTKDDFIQMPVRGSSKKSASSMGRPFMNSPIGPSLALLGRTPTPLASCEQRLPLVISSLNSMCRWRVISRTTMPTWRIGLEQSRQILA